jgi:Uma2 family endonuclease
MPVSEEIYRQLALEDPEGHWELRGGCLRRKPDMTLDHNRITRDLFFDLRRQLDPEVFDVVINMGQVRLPGGSYYIPDVYVVPVAMQRELRGRPVLEAYEGPLPLVVEVWSPSTGEYDVETKLHDYQQRGDLEIWRVHPYDRTVTTWVRQLYGAYEKTIYGEGVVRPSALPSVAIDLPMLFR